jgi:acyl-CoA reductase-like NAD-dependent aldehyde dehydrogenase
MSASYQAVLDQTMAAFRRRRAALRADLDGVSGTATAPRQVVSVTVGPAGAITALRFPTNAYKSMAPAELAAVIMKTAEEARTLARDGLAELLGPLPDGISAVLEEETDG